MKSKFRTKPSNPEDLKEYLQNTARGLSWEVFENTQQGVIHPRGSAVAFYMRVGMYMGRPTQAIMAEGQFVRVRLTNRWNPKILELDQLEPSHPNSTLYRQHSQARNTRTWIPQIRRFKYLGSGT